MEEDKEIRPYHRPDDEDDFPRRMDDEDEFEDENEDESESESEDEDESEHESESESEDEDEDEGGDDDEEVGFETFFDMNHPSLSFYISSAYTTKVIRCV